ENLKEFFTFYELQRINELPGTQLSVSGLLPALDQTSARRGHRSAGRHQDLRQPFFALRTPCAATFPTQPDTFQSARREAWAGWTSASLISFGYPSASGNLRLRSLYRSPPWTALRPGNSSGLT